MAKPQRDAQDPWERIEWQLDQIRVNTLVVGLLAALALLGAVLSFLAAAGS